MAGIIYALQYYAPHYDKRIHQEILSSLAEIKRTHEVDYEVVELRTKTTEYGSFVDDRHEKELYESHFLPRTHILGHRTGASLRRSLRSRSGNFNLAGTVAVIQNGLVEWFTCYESCERFPKQSKSDDYAIRFLRALSQEGPSLLASLCPRIEGQRRAFVEQEMLGEFIASRVLDGTWRQEVKIGSRRRTVDVGGEKVELDWRKRIDCVCEATDGVWVIEAKRKLNYEAIGEVLTYATLYRSQLPNRAVRSAIVCREVEPELLQACDANTITVFWAHDGIVETFRPSNLKSMAFQTPI